MEGKRFGKWTVIEKSSFKKRWNTYWICECECGTKKDVVGYSLKNGKSKSCGCGVEFNFKKRNGIEERIKEIRKLLKRGYTQRDILVYVKTSPSTIVKERKKLHKEYKTSNF